MTPPTRLLFLPGASGNTDFWRPVAGLLTHPAQQVFIGWPGVGTTPADAGVTGVQDFVARTVACIDQPTALVAQSMGCVVALLAATQRPRFVTHVVFAALSGGVDTLGLGAQDWRPPVHETRAGVQHAFARFSDNLEPLLEALTAKTLLLWGDDDPLSPVAVGQHVASLCRHSALQVIAGGSHTFAHAQARQVAPLIDGHLLDAVPPPSR